MNSSTDSQNNSSAGSFAQMGEWLESPLGQALLQSEQELLDKLLPRRFGYHLLQLGCSDETMWDSSPIGHKFSITADSSALGQMVVAAGESLPLASESVDLILLHHSLDLSSHQHQLLREVARVLIAGGDVIVVGFNPRSCWGIRKFLQWPKKAPWLGQLLTPGRVADWLKLLEFQVEKVHYGLFCLPVNYPRIIKYTSILNRPASYFNWPTGGIYVITAKKQVLPLTLVQDPWHKLSRRQIGIPLAESPSRVSKLVVDVKKNSKQP